MVNMSLDTIRRAALKAAPKPPTKPQVKFNMYARYMWQRWRVLWQAVKADGAELDKNTVIQLGGYDGQPILRYVGNRVLCSQRVPGRVAKDGEGFVGVYLLPWRQAARIMRYRRGLNFSLDWWEDGTKPMLAIEAIDKTRALLHATTEPKGPPKPDLRFVYRIDDTRSLHPDLVWVRRAVFRDPEDQSFGCIVPDGGNLVCLATDGRRIHAVHIGEAPVDEKAACIWPHRSLPAVAASFRQEFDSGVSCYVSKPPGWTVVEGSIGLLAVKHNLPQKAATSAINMLNRARANIAVKLRLSVRRLCRHLSSSMRIATSGQTLYCTRTKRNLNMTMILAGGSPLTLSMACRAVGGKDPRRQVSFGVNARYLLDAIMPFREQEYLVLGLTDDNPPRVLLIGERHAALLAPVYPCAKNFTKVHYEGS